MKMSSNLRLLLALLAVYRLANIITKESGPGFIFARLRSYTDHRHAAEQNARIKQGPWANLDEGLRCPFCLGVWLAGLLTLLLFYPSRLGDMFIMLFGLAGGQALLQERRPEW